MHRWGRGPRTAEQQQAAQACRAGEAKEKTAVNRFHVSSANVAAAT
jgi:hypothetical protein